MESSCYVRGSVRCCAVLVLYAMPRAFLSCWSSLRDVLVSYGFVVPGCVRDSCRVFQPGVSLHYLPEL